MDPNKRTLTVDLRIIIGLLLAIIVAMLFLWRPWDATGATDRTVQVTGSTSLKAAPDEFVFYPSYEFKNSNREVALKELSAKSEEVTKKLKELGVADSKIKSNSSGYDYYLRSDDSTTYNLQLTVTAGSQELAQKVQDYLLTTAPTGSVSPQASFSESKRKELETKAREQATKDARNKADQMGKNLGFKLGKVKSIDDGSGFNVVRPYDARGGTALSTEDKANSTQLQVQPGENELPYEVTVTYFIK